VRLGRAQRTGERALRSSKTAGGASRVRVRLGTVCKEGSGTLRVMVRPMTVRKGGVRAGMVRKTVLRVL
jgi:hypothetical protein